MHGSSIITEVNKLIKRYDETEPAKLCSLMDVKLNYRRMGTSGESIKGFFLVNRRIRVITVNSDLPYSIQRIIVAHELGHAVLHRASGIQAFHDISLYDESSLLEKEANLFAAEILLSDDDVYSALRSCGSFYTAAASLNVPPELLDFKCRLMKSQGYSMPRMSFDAKSRFLKDLKVQEYDEFGC